MTGSRRKRIAPPLPVSEAVSLSEHLGSVAANFVGEFGELESALGMMFVGRLFGWKVLVLVHNKRTLRKYEEILGIDVRKEFPEIGPLADKSVGLELSTKLGAFWKAVSGDIKVPGKRELRT